MWFNHYCICQGPRNTQLDCMHLVEVHALGWSANDSYISRTGKPLCRHLGEASSAMPCPACLAANAALLKQMSRLGLSRHMAAWSCLGSTPAAAHVHSRQRTLYCWGPCAAPDAHAAGPAHLWQPVRCSACIHSHSLLVILKGLGEIFGRHLFRRVTDSLNDCAVCQALTKLPPFICTSCCVRCGWLCALKL